MVSKQNPHSCTVSMTMLVLLFLYKGRQSYQRWTAGQEEERWQAEWINDQQVKYNNGRRREFLNSFISKLSEFLISHPSCPLSTNFLTFSREDISGIFYDQIPGFQLGLLKGNTNPSVMTPSPGGFLMWVGVSSDKASCAHDNTVN